MPGRVTSFSIVRSTGVIRGADGRRYQFSVGELLDLDDLDQLDVGSVVRFTETHDGHAIEVELLARRAA